MTQILQLANKNFKVGFINIFKHLGGKIYTQWWNKWVSYYIQKIQQQQKKLEIPELNSTEKKKKNWIDLTADQIWQKKAVNSKSLKTETEENKG